MIDAADTLHMLCATLPMRRHAHTPYADAVIFRAAISPAPYAMPLHAIICHDIDSDRLLIFHAAALTPDIADFYAIYLIRRCAMITACAARASAARLSPMQQRALSAGAARSAIYDSKARSRAAMLRALCAARPRLR